MKNSLGANEEDGKFAGGGVLPISTVWGTHQDNYVSKRLFSVSKTKVLGRREGPSLGIWDVEDERGRSHRAQCFFSPQSGPGGHCQPRERGLLRTTADCTGSAGNGVSFTDSFDQCLWSFHDTAGTGGDSRKMRRDKTPSPSPCRARRENSGVP